MVPQEPVAEVGDLLVTPQDFRRRDGKTIRLCFPILCSHDMALMRESQGGRGAFAACRRSQLYELGRQERLILQAQRGR